MNYINGPIQIRDAKTQDVQALKDRLRHEDKEEVLASGFRSVEDCLEFGIARSTEAYTVLINGIPSALFGINPGTLLGDKAVIWFLGASEMCQIKKTFMKLSRMFVKEWLSRYNCLYNVVPKSYEKSIAWLKWLGARCHSSVSLRGTDCFLMTIERGN